MSQVDFFVTKGLVTYIEHFDFNIQKKLTFELLKNRQDVGKVSKLIFEDIELFEVKTFDIVEDDYLEQIIGIEVINDQKGDIYTLLTDIREITFKTVKKPILL